jgi:hypothetical protein
MTEYSENKIVHKDGRSWENKGPFKSYDDAFTAKVEFDAKHRQSESKIKALIDGFYLKTRKKISEVLEEQRQQLDQEKTKKEKKRLNKDT